jgi:hypothetical protein
LPKGLGALGTLVRKVGDALIVVPITVGQLRNIRHVSRHALLGLRKLVDLLSSIVLSSTARAEPALHMLDGVGSRLETGVSTHRASDVAGTMNLHMHIKVVLVLKGTVTDAALVGRRRVVEGDTVDATFAPRPSFAFCPLVPAKVAAREVLIASRACSSHDNGLSVLFFLAG